MCFVLLLVFWSIFMLYFVVENVAREIATMCLLLMQYCHVFVCSDDGAARSVQCCDLRIHDNSAKTRHICELKPTTSYMYSDYWTHLTTKVHQSIRN